jgi:L,D-transpeptidase catalytic domain
MSYQFKKIALALMLLPLFTGLISQDTPATAQTKKIAFQSLCGSGACLRLLKKTEQGFNKLGNPIYTVELYMNGKIINSFNAVSGRAHTQNLNRNRSGNHSPLPDGVYSVSSSLTDGTVYEVGGKFLPITPRFSTSRSALGIHYDPSYNKNNGEDGTSGCIALTTRADRDLVYNFILKNKVKTLVVEIQ